MTLTGYQREELIGRHYSLLYPAELQRRADVGLKEAAAVARCETTDPRQRKDHDRFTAHTVIDALRQPDGFLWGFSVIARDITEWTEAQEQLRALRRPLRALAARLQKVLIPSAQPLGHVPVQLVHVN